MAKKERSERIRRRVTCELLLGGRAYRGIVLDLSATGIFVQTEATPAPGACVRVRFHRQDRQELEVEATVARRQAVPRELASVARSGLGLRVERPPAAYFELLGVEGVTVDRGASAGVPPLPPASASGRAPAAAAAQPAATVPAPDLRRAFRVRAKQTSGPRSRTLEVRAVSKDEARQRALADLGAGWEILTVEAA